MANIKLKNLLAENMRRFGTKNLNEQNQTPLKLTAEQQKRWEDAMVARFYWVAADEATPTNKNVGYMEAARDLAYAGPAIAANILCGFDPLENKHNEYTTWDEDPQRPNDLTHPYNKLRQLGYNIEDVDELGTKLYREFINKQSSDKKVNFVQRWAQVDE